MKSLKVFIAEHLEQTELFEMAMSLHDYKERLMNIMPIMLAHIILVKYKPDDINVNHWKNEISGYIRRFVGARLKTSNTVDSRISYIEKVVYNMLELNDVQVFIENIDGKLYDEGINVEDNKVYAEVSKVVNKFIDEDFDRLIEVIASNNINERVKFVEEL